MLLNKPFLLKPYPPRTRILKKKDCKFYVNRFGGLIKLHLIQTGIFHKCVNSFISHKIAKDNGVLFS